MAILTYRKFTGPDGAAATAQLQAAMDDGSFPVKAAYGQPTALWMTLREVMPGAMQMPFFELHVVAWVDNSGAPEEASSGT